MDIEFARQQMIEQQVRAWDVIDPQVLDIMRRVPREQFLPEEWRDSAFTDIELPIGCGQRSFAPKLEGRILQALAPTPTDVCLEIGTGCGYLTACLAHMSKRVVTIEREQALADRAREVLAKHAPSNVEVLNASAPEGLPEQRFDLVVVGGSVRRNLRSIELTMAVGGRALVVLDGGEVMTATRIERVSEDHWLREGLVETRLAPLHGYGPVPVFKF